MTATRSIRLVALLPLSLALLIGTASTGIAQATKTAKVKGPIDLNSATAEELSTLPGIGEVNARKIIDSRPHKVAADLVKAGIPAGEVEKITPMVVVRPLPPAVAVNTDPEDKLQTLPGVGPVLAKEIVAGRPYYKYEDLERLKGMGPKKLDELKGRVSFARPEPARTEAKKADPAREKMTKTAKAPAIEKAKLAPGEKVNLNTASKEQLDVLPGIGPARAQLIIDARPFSKVEDVMKIKGIKEVEFGKIKDMITVK